MLRKLTEQDREQVLNYLYQEPSINIFAIGDIENFGFDVDFQDVFAEFNDLGEYCSVLLRYKENILYYSHKQYFNTEWLDVIDIFDHRFISAKRSLMDLINVHFKTYREKPMYFCEATKFTQQLDDSNIIDCQTEEEIGKVYDLLIQITEFDGMKHQEKQDFIQSKLESLKYSKTYSIEENNKCMSTVSTVADTKKAAMVVAVATDKEARQKGYASKLMIKIMHEYLVNRNKYLCLFYDNPAAGKIYHRLGFKDTDMWVMLIRE